MKATEQYFPVVLFIMLYKMVLTFKSVDEILKCDHSNIKKNIRIFHYHRVYHELTIDHLSMWLGSSVDRALHRFRKVMGSNRVQA